MEITDIYQLKTADGKSFFTGGTDDMRSVRQAAFAKLAEMAETETDPHVEIWIATKVDGLIRKQVRLGYVGWNVRTRP